MSNNYNKLRSIIAKELNCQVADIDENSGWKITYNWDSLAHIGIITSIENHFSIKIEDNQIENLKDFNCILEYLDNKK